MTDKEAMNVASQCRATASADLCKNILVDGGSGFLFELLLDAAKAIETLAQEKALQVLHNENERLGLYKDAYAEPVQYKCTVMDNQHPNGIPLEQWVKPPQRTWVGLTKEQISEFDAWHDNREEEVGWVNPSEIVAYIDAKLKQKNGYAEEKNT